MFRNRLFPAMAVLGGALWFGLGDSAQAAPPAARSYRPPVIVNRPVPNNHMPGWDWQRTYPWSPYNAWRNPYWYYPYTPYVAPPYSYGAVPSVTDYNSYNPTLPPVPPPPPVPPIN